MKKIHNFSINPDRETLRQFEQCCNEKFVVEAALMPDAHLGYVAPVGSVLVAKDYIVPSWVGYDIGCGMTAVKIKNKKILESIRKNAEMIYNEVRKNVPMGLGEINRREGITEEAKKDFHKLIEKFKKKEHDKEVLRFLENGNAILNLGSLGHGNHFIELCYSENGYAWIVVHSGSRGVGHKVAKKYMQKSAGKDEEFEKTYPLHKDSEAGKEYLNVLDFCLEFALLNRIEIIRKVISSIQRILEEKIKWEVWVNKNHNHAILEKGKFIHRKGATPAKKRERGVIPANMRDGSFLVIGLGNKDFINSSSHGAGRIYSRSDAKRKISMDDFKKSMAGIKGTVNEETIDEAPMAYKNIYDVMKVQKKSVKVLEQLKPVINWKGTRYMRR